MATPTILLRFSDLKKRNIVNNRATLSRWIRNRKFPPGFMMGMNTRVWTEAEIEKLLTERARESAKTEALEFEKPLNKSPNLDIPVEESLSGSGA